MLATFIEAWEFQAYLYIMVYKTRRQWPKHNISNTYIHS
jgi:hypothetical protein